MVMCMHNMLALMMVIFLGLFGFPRPLLLTKEDPLKNGYLKISLIFCKLMLDSGCTSHMTGSSSIVKELKPNDDQISVTYADKSKSKVMGFGKVVVAHDITLVNVMLVETLGYNLLSFLTLGKMGFAVFIDVDIVVLLWSKSLKVAFVGHVEHDLY